MPGLCLYDWSNYGSFPSLENLALLHPRQVLSTPSIPFSSSGTWHSCQSCAISETAGTSWACPTIFPSLSLSSLHPSPQLLCISLDHLGPQRALHSTFFFQQSIHSSVQALPVFNFLYLKVPSADSSCWYFLLCLSCL